MVVRFIYWEVLDQDNFDINNKTCPHSERAPAPFGTGGGHRVLMFHFFNSWSMKLILISVSTSSPLLTWEIHVSFFVINEMWKLDNSSGKVKVTIAIINSPQAIFLIIDKTWPFSDNVFEKLLLISILIFYS